MQRGGAAVVFSSFIVWYLFLAGVSSGAFIFIAILPVNESITNPSHIDHQRARVAAGYLAVAICAFAASIILLSDFGDPWITWRVVLTPFASLASFGACVVMVFVLVAAAVTVVMLIKPVVPRWAVWLSRLLGIPLAAATMVYAGLLLAGMLAIDVWHTWLLPVLFVVSSLSCGIAIILFMEAFVPGKDEEGRPPWWKTQFVLGLLEAAVLAAFIVDRFNFSATAHESIIMLLVGDYALGFWLGIVVLGLVVPVLLHILYPFARVYALGLAAAVSILIGGFFLRWCVVEIALYTPFILLS
ncbi:MAG: polysulfide reductase NrfD [Coriobacteriales bacterium]|nr:polysulfide reductase NrfD [Coriobacteriales bacterium]